MTQIFKLFALLVVLMSVFVGGLSVSPVFAEDPTDFDPTSIGALNGALSGVGPTELIQAQAAAPSLGQLRRLG